MRTICYYPELVQMSGSINAALMMGQLEFWFKITGGKAFYKFLEPCAHELYKVGDSWSEELSMTSSEIRSAFKHIGTMYKSKSAFQEAMKSQDIFKDKPYAAYYDRMRKTTYYFRNDDKVKEMLPQAASQICAKRDGSAHQDITAEGDGSEQPVLQLAQDKIENDKKSASVTEETQSGLYREDYRINNIENNTRESLTHVTIPFTEIVSLYNDILGEKLGYVRQLTPTDKNNITNLWKQHHIQLEAFKKGFTKVAASKFLCGKIEGKNWRASLQWLLTRRHLIKVLEGVYDDFTGPLEGKSKYSVSEKVKNFNQMDSHYFDFDEIERLERLYIDHKLEGQFSEFKMSM